MKYHSKLLMVNNMIQKKIIWETSDGQQFLSETEANEHERINETAAKIQNLLIEQNIDPVEWAPADAARWIAENALPITQFINEGFNLS